MLIALNNWANSKVRVANLSASCSPPRAKFFILFDQILLTVSRINDNAVLKEPTQGSLLRSCLCV